MVDITSFYDVLDLKYPEIGINIEAIDRWNPGLVKMIIPILTPNMDNTKKINTKIHQDSRNLMNINKTLDIRSIEVSNYIEIPFPREICTINSLEENLIPAWSKWIVVFVGGDITKPRPIARYLE